MSIKSKFKKINDAYVIKQAQRAKLPKFAPDSIRRYKVTFSGRGQKVDFRLEVCELAKRLGLTGYCKNLHSLGPVTVYSHLQACGIINDHSGDCPCAMREATGSTRRFGNGGTWKRDEAVVLNGYDS